jgi:hypothetical protein
MENEIKPIVIPQQLIDFIESLERNEKWISDNLGIPESLIGEIKPKQQPCRQRH